MKLKSLTITLFACSCLTSFTPASLATEILENTYGISLYDSQIYSPLFTTPEMIEIFNDKNLISLWLKYEIALAKAQASINMIPQEAAQAIEKTAQLQNIDIQKLSATTLKVGRPVDGLVKQLRKQDPLVNQYIHLGSTTQDVMDTATVLQIQAACNVIDKQLRDVIQTLATLANKYSTTPMVARTNGQDAIPTTLGMMFASYMTEFNRNRIRLLEAKSRVEVGQFGSAVGTLSSAGPNALKVRELTLHSLGLKVPDFSWNASRDNYAEVVQTLGLIAGTFGRIATDINILSRTADNSINEGEGGPSSTMPQKRNPRASEFMGGLAAMARIRATGALEMLQQSEVRQGSPWISEWSTIPEMFMITSTGLARTEKLFEKIIIRPNVLLARFNDSQLFVMSEAAQQMLAQKVGLGQAHSLLVKAIKKYPDLSFEEILKIDDAISKLLSNEE